MELGVCIEWTIQAVQTTSSVLSINLSVWKEGRGDCFGLPTVLPESNVRRGTVACNQELVEHVYDLNS